ncbi:MAG: AAA family ATPase, partial [Chlamydiae bacterium]|nr:AAA family ATPase [Chlamydiota bacterium]
NSHNQWALYRMLQLIALGNHPFLVGEAGAGKSILARAVAKLIGGPKLNTFDCHTAMRQEDLIRTQEIGTERPRRRGKTAKVPRMVSYHNEGPLLTGYRNGQPTVLEEAGDMPSGVAAALSEALASRTIDLLEERVCGGPGAVVIATGNPADSRYGTGHGLDAMIKDRFAFIHMEPLRAKDMAEFLKDTDPIHGYSLNPRVIGNEVPGETIVVDGQSEPRYDGLVGVYQYLRAVRSTDPNFPFKRLPGYRALEKMIKKMMNAWPEERKTRADSMNPTFFQDELIKLFRSNFVQSGRAKSERGHDIEDYLEQALRESGLWLDPVLDARDAFKDGVEKFLKGEPMRYRELDILREPKSGDVELDHALEQLQKVNRGMSPKTFLTAVEKIVDEWVLDQEGWSKLPFHEVFPESERDRRNIEREKLTRLERVYRLRETWQILNFIIERGEGNSFGQSEPVNFKRLVAVRDKITTRIHREENWPQSFLRDHATQDDKRKYDEAWKELEESWGSPPIFGTAEHPELWALDDLLGKLAINCGDAVYVGQVCEELRKNIAATTLLERSEWDKLSFEEQLTRVYRAGEVWRALKQLEARGSSLEVVQAFIESRVRDLDWPVTILRTEESEEGLKTQMDQVVSCGNAEMDVWLKKLTIGREDEVFVERAAGALEVGIKPYVERSLPFIRGGQGGVEGPSLQGRGKPLHEMAPDLWVLQRVRENLKELEARGSRVEVKKPTEGEEREGLCVAGDTVLPIIRSSKPYFNGRVWFSDACHGRQKERQSLLQEYLLEVFPYITSLFRMKPKTHKHQYEECKHTSKTNENGESPKKITRQPNSENRLCQITNEFTDIFLSFSVSHDQKVASRITATPTSQPNIIEYLPIVNVRPGDYVLSLNESTATIEPHRIKGLLDMGVKPIYELVTESGKRIKTTANHPYLVLNGWEARELGSWEAEELGNWDEELSFEEGKEDGRDRCYLSDPENEHPLNQVSPRTFDFGFYLSQTLLKFFFSDLQSCLLRLSLNLVQNLSQLFGSFVAQTFTQDLRNRDNSHKNLPRTRITAFLEVSSSWNSPELPQKGGVQFSFFQNLSCIMQGSFDMSGGETWVGFTNFLDRGTCFQHFQNQVDHNSCSLETGLAMADFRINRDELFDLIERSFHTRILSHFIYLALSWIERWIFPSFQPPSPFLVNAHALSYSFSLDNDQYKEGQRQKVIKTKLLELQSFAFSFPWMDEYAQSDENDSQRDKTHTQPQGQFFKEITGKTYCQNGFTQIGDVFRNKLTTSLIYDFHLFIFLSKAIMILPYLTRRILSPAASSQPPSFPAVSQLPSLSSWHKVKELVPGMKIAVLEEASQRVCFEKIKNCFKSTIHDP